MPPFLPRMHLFEIDDQKWFPSFLRARVQDGLTIAWTMHVKHIQTASPASLAADTLIRELGPSLTSHAYVDFCAGGGGPTPSIERCVNEHLRAQGHKPVEFVLTDLHPNVSAWTRAAAASPQVGFVSEPVDASAVQQDLVAQYTTKDRSIFRLFNLAFHHFEDPLAKAILKNTVETSDGFAIFELQDRNLSSALSIVLFGLGIMICAPYYAWKWRSLTTLVFTYLIPILPFVLVFDGLISALRTRTPEEVEALLRTCGADVEGWEIRSGRTRHLWPSSYLVWLICTKKEGK